MRIALRVGVILFSVFIFAGCSTLSWMATGTADFASIVPSKEFNKNSQKMFDVAITTGIKEGFNVTHRNVNNGLIVLEKSKGKGTCVADGWRIEIQFVKFGEKKMKAWDTQKGIYRETQANENGFILTGRTICDSYASFEASIRRIEGAIIRVSDQ